MNEWNNESAHGESADGGEEVEGLLHQAPLRRPSPMMDARVQRVLQGRARRRLLRPAAAGLAAAVILATGGAAWWLGGRGTPHPHVPQVSVVPRAVAPVKPPDAVAPVRTTSADSASTPLRVERTFARVTSDGVVGVAAGAPVRRLRGESVRQLWLIDPDSGERVSVTIPFEKVVLHRVEPF